MVARGSHLRAVETHERESARSKRREHGARAMGRACKNSANGAGNRGSAKRGARRRDTDNPETLGPGTALRGTVLLRTCEADWERTVSDLQSRRRSAERMGVQHGRTPGHTYGAGERSARASGSAVLTRHAHSLNSNEIRAHAASLSNGWPPSPRASALSSHPQRR